MANDLYIINEVARLLDLHDKTTRNYVRGGWLQASRVGRQYRIPRART